MAKQSTWTSEQDEELTRLVQDEKLSDQAVADRMGKPVGSIWHRRTRLGLKSPYRKHGSGSTKEAVAERNAQTDEMVTVRRADLLALIRSARFAERQLLHHGGTAGLIWQGITARLRPALRAFERPGT